MRNTHLRCGQCCVRLRDYRDALHILTCGILILLFLLFFPVVLERILDGTDDVENGVFGHPGFQTALHHVPQRLGNSHGMPVPDIRPASHVGVALEQFGGELFLQSCREGLHDRSIRARKSTALWCRVCNTGRAFANVFAADDKEWLFEIVNLDRPGFDPTAVRQQRRTGGAWDPIEYEWERVPIKESMLREGTGIRTGSDEGKVRWGGRKPECFENRVQRRDRMSVFCLICGWG